METFNISTIKCILDQDLSIVCANDFFYVSIGYTQQEFIELYSCLRKYCEKYIEEFDKLKEAAMMAFEKGESSFSADCRLRTKKEDFIWVRINGTIMDETVEGSPVFFAVCTDISDIMDEKERKSQYFEWLMDEYTGNIYISDMDTYELLYLNKESCKTLQASKNELVGRKCYEVIQGRTSPCDFCTNNKLTYNKFYEWEFFNPVLDRTFLIKNRIIDWNGHKSRIELSHDMISVEYKLAKKDREREALLRTVPGSFARIDARDFCTVLWYGAEFLNMIGYTKRQFENELYSQCTYFHDEDLKRIQGVMKEIQETGQSTALEVRILTYSKETRIQTITLCYVSGEESWDGIPSFYSVGIDVTKEREEQSRQRRALEDAYKTASVASSAKTNFLSAMSHDIRTPINAIMGMAAIAQVHRYSPEKVSDCLSKINVSSKHLLSLINEVLDMSKIESGKIDLVLEEVSLSDLVQDVSDMCKPLVNEKGLDLKINIGYLRHERIIADGDRLQQVFMNLLSNSIKYTLEGGIISVMINELPSLNPKKGQYKFTFEDNGIGMSSDYIPHIFEPFSRAEDSRISKVQGTGLGMAITENIIRMMNGSIEVKSELGKGTEIIVSVQFEIAGEDEVCDTELEGMHVLVVDDDRIVCENAVALLNELGMRGYWTLSGAEAVDILAEAHNRADDFYAVILDWKMPEMDGLETVKAIRAQVGENIPVIIISAYDYSSIEEEFLCAGANAFITKPLFKSKMLHVLQLFCVNCKADNTDLITCEKPPSLLGKRILLVEDNDLNREIAKELLEMKGVVVESAENGQLAVEAFESSAPGYYDAILMDIQMPVMNGYDATIKIRNTEHKDAKGIPILALTANAFTEDVSKSHSAGMNDHIAKPVDIRILTEILQKWIYK